MCSVTQWSLLFCTRTLLALLQLSFVYMVIIFLRLALELRTFSNLVAKFRILGHVLTLL